MEGSALSSVLDELIGSIKHQALLHFSSKSTEQTFLHGRCQNYSHCRHQRSTFREEGAALRSLKTARRSECTARVLPASLMAGTLTTFYFQQCPWYARLRTLRRIPAQKRQHSLQTLSFCRQMTGPLAPSRTTILANFSA